MSVLLHTLRGRNSKAAAVTSLLFHWNLLFNFTVLMGLIVEWACDRRLHCFPSVSLSDREKNTWRELLYRTEFSLPSQCSFCLDLNILFQIDSKSWHQHTSELPKCFLFSRLCWPVCFPLTNSCVLCYMINCTENMFSCFILSSVLWNEKVLLRVQYFQKRSILCII